MDKSTTIEQNIQPENFQPGKWLKPFQTLTTTAKNNPELVSSHKLGDKNALHIALDNFEPPANLKSAEERKMLTVIIDGPKASNFLVQARLAYIPDTIYQADAETVNGEVIYQNWRKVTIDPKTHRKGLSEPNPFTLLSLDASRLEIFINNHKKQIAGSKNLWQ